MIDNDQANGLASVHEVEDGVDLADILSGRIPKGKRLGIELWYNTKVPWYFIRAKKTAILRSP
jgi:hypothetical protein